LNGQGIQQVGKRQPHGADLLPAGRQAVEHSPRDDEMTAGVVVAERQAEAVIVNRDARATASGRGGERKTERAPPRRYNHLFML